LIATGLHGPENKIKPLVRAILIQAYLEIRRHGMVGEIHCTPLNVKDAIGRGA
jgi:hypothetical protein